MTVGDTSHQQEVNTPERREVFAKVNKKGQVTIPKQIREVHAIPKAFQLNDSANGIEDV
ncbi:MAG: hypothetical protein ACFFDT_14835 [Candidatus Hodarchaeota archaeon]